MKTIEETYRERLRMLIKEYGSQAELSSVIDKSPAQISQWLNASPSSTTGKPRSLKSDTAREIERMTGKPHAWFDQPITEDETNITTPSQGYIRFELLNAQAAMGIGVINNEYMEVVDYISVAESWAKSHLGNNLKDIRVITAKGDSMHPTIANGSVLFVDSSVHFFNGEGIYILATTDGLRAKRLQKKVNGNLLVISDNKSYRDEEISGEDLNHVQICGLVKGAWLLAEFK